MKALAARTRNVDDLRLLAEMIGVDSAAAAVQICEINSHSRHDAISSAQG
jgi:hypothetical protein